jgi:carbonic anhydrase
LGNDPLSTRLEDSRERLLAGVRRFRQEVYPRHHAEYRRLVREGQRPHALFITCADSRIDPELLTQSGPGEIFVCRNVGNLVPTFTEAIGGVSAIIEYAVAALQVGHIVVCGHTDCGAMIGLLHPERVVPLPAVRLWLHQSDAALRIVRKRNTAQDDQTALDELIQENVLLQLRHLQTHPSVAERLGQGTLGLSGWVYDIAHGTVRIYCEEQQRFLSPNPEVAVT